jgi:hypothetical protein
MLEPTVSAYCAHYATAEASMQATKFAKEIASVWQLQRNSYGIASLAFQTFHGFQRFQMLFGIHPLDRLERLELLEPPS